MHPALSLLAVIEPSLFNLGTSWASHLVMGHGWTCPRIGTSSWHKSTWWLAVTGAITHVKLMDNASPEAWMTRTSHALVKKPSNWTPHKMVFHCRVVYNLQRRREREDIYIYTAALTSTHLATRMSQLDKTYWHVYICICLYTCYNHKWVDIALISPGSPGLNRNDKWRSFGFT